MEINKKRKRYLIQANLGEFTNQIITVYWYPELKQYFDSSGNISCTDKDYHADGIIQLVFKCRRDASIALKGARMVATRLKSWLS